MLQLKKITPYNGFYQDANAGQQNNYAWSMAELGDYIYVGTGRNIVFSVLVSAFDMPPSDVPEAFTPKPFPDMNAEIWRYKKDGSIGWERVFKADPRDGVIGFRFMIYYNDALYAGAFSTGTVKIFMSKTGAANDWHEVTQGIAEGDSTRAMVVHNGKLYLGCMRALGGSTQTILYESSDPQNNGWTLIDTLGDPNLNPRGEVASLLSFNNHLYVGTAPPGGFEIWRTNDIEPLKDNWTLVVDKGAGEALNELPLSMAAFNGDIYVGTGIWFGIYSIDPSKRYVPPKGFDLIKIDSQDYWEVIVGNEPMEPTQPTTKGIRRPIIPAGLGDISNAYCWQLAVYKGKLYLSTWDWSVLLPTFLIHLINNHKEIAKNIVAQDDINQEKIKEDKKLLSEEYNYWPLITSILQSIIMMPISMGGDLWESCTGIDWRVVSITGLRHPHNYGLRILLPASNGYMYIGTANPYEGCEVWVSKERQNKYCMQCVNRAGYVGAGYNYMGYDDDDSE